MEPSTPCAANIARDLFTNDSARCRASRRAAVAPRFASGASARRPRRAWRWTFEAVLAHFGRQRSRARGARLLQHRFAKNVRAPLISSDHTVSDDHVGLWTCAIRVALTWQTSFGRAGRHAQELTKEGSRPGRSPKRRGTPRVCSLRRNRNSSGGWRRSLARPQSTSKNRSVYR